MADNQTDKQSEKKQKSKDRGCPFRAFGVPHFSLSSRSGPIRICLIFLLIILFFENGRTGNESLFESLPGLPK